MVDITQGARNKRLVSASGSPEHCTALNSDPRGQKRCVYQFPIEELQFSHGILFFKCPSPAQFLCNLNFLVGKVQVSILIFAFANPHLPGEGIVRTRKARTPRSRKIKVGPGGSHVATRCRAHLSPALVAVVLRPKHQNGPPWLATSYLLALMCDFQVRRRSL
jgi:hypothetical protein